MAVDRTATSGASLAPQPLSVCYIPGLDLRRVTAESTPFLYEAVRRYSSTRIDTVPITELVPTLLTGVGPEDHGYWQLKLHPDAARRRQRLLDRLPDRLTTFALCLVHLVHPAFDLSAIPPRRRRRFELTRFKYTRRQQSADVIGTIGGYDSIIGLLGPDRARYRFSKRLDELGRIAEELADASEDFILAEVYGLDLMQHWSLDQPERVGEGYQLIDHFVARADRLTRASGRRMVLLVDHGQELVQGSIDLVSRLRALDLREDEYSHFLDVPMARFWFHTDRARERIRRMLEETPHGRTFEWQDLAQYGVPFDNADYGELYFAADPGYILFPHDFYHPVANLFLGLRDWQQAPRIRNPIHRGSHGHLPDHDSERGWMVVFDPSLEFDAPAIRLRDVAPTLLGLAGHPAPGHMRGRSALRAARTAVGAP